MQKSKTNNAMDLDYSVTMSNSEILRFLDNTNVSESPTLFRNIYNAGNNTTIGILPVDTNHKIGDQLSDGHNLTEHLYGHFLEVLQSRTDDSEVFDTVQDLIQTCSDTIDELAKHGRHAGGRGGIDDNNVWLIHERNTWRLLYCLFKDRLIVQKESNDFDDLPMVGSEKVIVEHLYTSNANLREYQLIVDWLEQNAYEESSSQIGHYTDRTVAWENTLHNLQMDDQTIFGCAKDVVKALDPDAPNREKMPLHDLDQDTEQRLAKQILRELRQGRIEDAQALCEYCGQSWKAAIYEGWRLFHDPNYDGTDPAVKTAIEGNPRRSLWKKYAWKMANCKQFDVYTRANVGILCGHLESVIDAFGDSSWSDLLWSYLKVQIDIRVESEIRSCCTKSYIEMPDEYWQCKMSLNEIFDELYAHKSSTIRTIATNPITIIQKYLILDDIPELMKNIDQWISDTKIDGQMLRFLTHIVLFMRQIGRQHQEDIADKVIKRYVESLFELPNFGSGGVNEQQHQLIAFYTAAISHHQQTQLYSKYLETLTATDDRKSALAEAFNVGLNVFAITNYTVEQIRNQYADEDEPKQLQGECNSIDARKISALEFLTVYPEQKGDLLWQANSMIRTFLAENKIECVRNVFQMTGPDELQQTIAYYGNVDTMPRREKCMIKEFLCHQSYLLAIDGYNDWLRCYHSKPKEPQLPTSSANFTERIAGEHKVQAFQQEIERWNLNVMEQTQIASEKLYNILLFPNQFLIDPDSEKLPNSAAAAAATDDDRMSTGIDGSNDEDDDENRQWEHRSVQLNNLRKLCIPEIVLLLQHVLHATGNYKECVRLSDVLVSESRQLYTVYTKQKFVELIGKLAESSLALMNEKMDPWGYSISS